MLTKNLNTDKAKKKMSNCAEFYTIKQFTLVNIEGQHKNYSNLFCFTKSEGPKHKVCW